MNTAALPNLLRHLAEGMLVDSGKHCKAAQPGVDASTFVLVQHWRHTKPKSEGRSIPCVHYTLRRQSSRLNYDTTLLPGKSAAAADADLCINPHCFICKILCTKDVNNGCGANGLDLNSG